MSLLSFESAILKFNLNNSLWKLRFSATAFLRKKGFIINGSIINVVVHIKIKAATFCFRGTCRRRKRQKSFRGAEFYCRLGATHI